MGSGEISPAEQGAVHRDIPSRGTAGAPQAPARSRRAKAPGEVCGRKGRPFRQRVIVASRTLTWNDFSRSADDDTASQPDLLTPAMCVGKRIMVYSAATGTPPCSARYHLEQEKTQ